MVNHIRYFIGVFIFILITQSIYGQESGYEKWKKKADHRYQKWREEADKNFTSYIKGWNNDSFGEEALAAEEAGKEAIIVDMPINANQLQMFDMPASATSGIRLWAVVVGVSEYAVDKLKLNYADDDAQTFARFLASPAGGGIPEERLFMHIDEDADHESVHESIKHVFSTVGENDGIIFYFSGHGSPTSFVLHDYGKPNVYLENGEAVNERRGLLSHRYLNYMIDNSKAKYKYCIIDACHSASMLESQSKSITELSQIDAFYSELDKSMSGSVYILSSMENEYSYETLNQNFKLRGGFFTYFLIKGIRGEADYNNDRIVTVVEAFDYCKKGVMAATSAKQNPAISGQYSYNMPIGVVMK